MLTPRCNVLCINFDIITLVYNHKKLFNICTVYHRIVALFHFFISEKNMQKFFPDLRFPSVIYYMKKINNILYKLKNI